MLETPIPWYTENEEIVLRHLSSQKRHRFDVSRVYVSLENEIVFQKMWKYFVLEINSYALLNTTDYIHIFSTDIYIQKSLNFNLNLQSTLY